MDEVFIKKLGTYFEKRDDVLFAFLFGSRAQNQSRAMSDWDIAVYVTPKSVRVEWEDVDREYPLEDAVRGDCIAILETDNVDLIILNRAPASIADAAMRGIPLVIKDNRMFLEFMLRTSAASEEYRQFVKEYYEVAERSKSLNEEDAAILRRSIRFIGEQVSLYDVYKKFTHGEYEAEPRKRNEIERWLENMMNAVIDISKIVVGSKKRPIPQTYRETIGQAIRIFELPDDITRRIGGWVELRNTLAHEYLDIKWKRLEDFAKTSESYVAEFVTAVKRFLEKEKPAG